jgi:hypothetical protein
LVGGKCKRESFLEREALGIFGNGRESDDSMLETGIAAMNNLSRSFVKMS